MSGKQKVEQTMAIINGQRNPLADRLPLECPLSISVTTANVCNLKCEFCAISDKTHKKNKSFMDLAEFELLVNRLIESNWHLKQIVLVGLGEPLLNKNIVEFVKIAKKANIADKIHIVTNGVLLSEELSDALINAGLDVLRVSLNGLTDDDYEKYTGVRISFEELYNNLSYFYDNKNANTKMYIKIMDYQVKNVEDAFYKKFSSISDSINIEYITEMSTTMDYSNVTGEIAQKGLKGFEKINTQICPLPFYHIYCNADATISACCVAGPWYTPPALIFGNLKNQRFDDIWQSKEFNSFLIKMLEKGKNEAHPICKKCKAYLSYIYPEDVIEGENSILRIVNELKNNVI